MQFKKFSAGLYSYGDNLLSNNRNNKDMNSKKEDNEYFDFYDDLFELHKKG
jgi:hypothetical protein